MAAQGRGSYPEPPLLAFAPPSSHEKPSLFRTASLPTRHRETSFMKPVALELLTCASRDIC